MTPHARSEAHSTYYYRMLYDLIPYVHVRPLSDQFSHPILLEHLNFLYFTGGHFYMTVTGKAEKGRFGSYYIGRPNVISIKDSDTK
jgi:hypothetical protein